MWLLLAWVSSVAGSVSLLGSAANLIPGRGNWQKILLFPGIALDHYMVLMSPCINQTWNLKNCLR